MKPIVLWGHWSSPNPWKVCTILKELDIPYEHRIIEFPATKQKPFIDVNPNGRLPAIEDPNTGIKLWESGAIILYLVDRYDPEHKISFDKGVDSYHCMQWLLFQTTGQGPYFGQLAWFARYHKEKLPSAIERYATEMDRVFGVLDKVLEHQNWLVGNKCTYADLSFATWSQVAKSLVKELGRDDVKSKYPHYSAWVERIEARKPVKECLDEIVRGRAEHGLPPY